MKLVEDLVKSYVAGNCLILVALPMSGKAFVFAAAETMRLTYALNIRRH